VRQTARGVNVSTVYRTLELLEQLGLVQHTHIHHGAPSYHLAEDAQHVHLVCRQCERVTEVDQAAVRPLVIALEEHEGFLTDVGHLTVFGLCAACAGSSRTLKGDRNVVVTTRSGSAVR
jgi:Fur family ferric uptake transcriptional regulator